MTKRIVIAPMLNLEETFDVNQLEMLRDPKTMFKGIDMHSDPEVMKTFTEEVVPEWGKTRTFCEAV